MKTRKPRLIIKKADALICAGVLLAAGVLFAFARTGKSGTAEIIIDGQTVYCADLTKAENAVLTWDSVTVEIHDGAIGFISSDCAGHDCVKTGFISRAGQSAVCIPNRALIKITGKKSGMPDAVTY